MYGAIALTAFVCWIVLRIGERLVVRLGRTGIQIATRIMGLMDDLVVVSLGIALAVKLVPPAVMAECRARARSEAKPRVRAANVAAAIVVAVWIGLSLWGALWIYRVFFQA